MNTYKTTWMCAGAALALVLLPTDLRAFQINGAVSFSGGFTAVDAATNVVTDLTGARWLLFGADAGATTIVNEANGDFGSLTFGTPVTMASPVAVNPAGALPAGPLWAAGTFSFVLSSISSTRVTNASMTLNGVGTVSAPGFDPTPGEWVATLNALGNSFSFSASALSTGTVCSVAIHALEVETNSLRVRQTGLFYQTVTVTNPCQTIQTGFRLMIYGLPAEVTVYNAFGYTNGTPFLYYPGRVGPSEQVTFSVEYFVANRTTIPNPTFAVVTTSFNLADISIELAPIKRAVPWRNGWFLLEFDSISNSTYYVQYAPTPNVATNWQTAFPSIYGTGRRIIGLDGGPPKTDSVPGNSRFYRLIRLH
jgi:hypothetical protein